MTASHHHFGGFQLRPSQRCLLADDQVVPLGARAFDVLLALVERRERVVGVDELFLLVWPGVVVEENNVRQQVAALRKILGAAAIVTVPGRGYRFAAEMATDAAVMPQAPTDAARKGGLAAHRMPQHLTPLLGREDDLPVVVQRLDETRLLTLTGAGGVGKTRLALAMAGIAGLRHRDGACFVELASVSDPLRVVQAIAAALGISEEPGCPLQETLLADLRRRDVLLVLDNCEHLIDACAEFVECALADSSDLRILATSREALEIPGESTWRVPSLRAAEPDRACTVEELMAYPATALFLQRAAAAAPDFRLTADNGAAVAQVCHQLDGIPLALELAAARLKSMRVEQLAERLHGRLGLLDDGSRSTLRRHRTLRALIDWSHDLLSTPERVVLRRISVFAGGWTANAAQAMCAADDLQPEAVMGVLTQLVEKSLVVLDGQSMAPRYRLLETIRQYAREKLLESADAGATTARHFEAQLMFATAAQPNFYRPGQARWYAAVDAELSNIRAALEWSVSNGAADRGLLLAQALHRYWVVRLYWREAVGWVQRLLAAQLPTARDALRASSLQTAGHIANYFDPPAALRLTAASLDIWRELRDASGTANVLWVMGWIESRHLDGRATPFFDESMRLAVAADFAMGAVHACAWHGAYQVAMGHYETAKPLLLAGIEWAQRMGGDATLIGRCEGNLALAEMLQGRFAQAHVHLERSQALAIEADNHNGVAESWWMLGRLAHCEGDFDRALACFGKSVGVYQPYASSVWVTRGLAYLVIVHAGAGRAGLSTRLAACLAARIGSIEDIQTALGSVAAIADYASAIAGIQKGRLHAHLQQAWTEGLAWSAEAAIEAALQPPPPSHVAPWKAAPTV